MADGRIVIDSRIQTGNLRSDAQQVNSELDRMTRNIASSSQRNAASATQAYSGMRRESQRAMAGMASDSERAYRGMGSAAQQGYSQQAGYARSSYAQQRADARAAYNAMGSEARAMHDEMRNAWRQQRIGMVAHNEALIRAQYGYFQLSQQMGTYRGSTAQFMSQVQALGKAHKAATDAAINGNTMARMSMIQTAGTMMNMSTQAEKIAANYERMGNPLLRINAGGLAAANALNRLALSGNASVLALKMLGPNASMKALVDMQNMITQGQMRIASVAMASAVTAGIAYSALWKAAKGPDPSTVYAAQEEALNKYTQAVKDRTQEIATAWGLFEKIQLNKTSGAQLTKNLQEQVTAMKNWNANLTSIASRTSKEFADYLSNMGPQAAGEIAALNAMSQPELDKYVALWQEKMRESRTRAVTELEGLKAETMAKIKELGDSLTPLGIAFEKFKQVWTEALKPMVAAFGAVMTPIIEFGTRIGELVVKFNEANPTMALFIQGAIMLVPLLTLLLSPLAAGVGLFNGIRVAMAGAWAIIGPLVTGLGAMTATVWIVAAALAGLVVGLTYLWNTNEGFRAAVIAAWEAIKAAAVRIWNAIYTNAIKPAFDAVMAFVQEKLAQLKQFWDENGAQIMQAASNAWNGIKSVIETVMNVLGPILSVAWEVIKFLVIDTWEAIKNVINGALNIIMGIVKVFTGLFTGDWSKMWEGVKQLFSGALELLWGWFQLWGAGKILKFLGKFVDDFVQWIVKMWDKVKSKWNDVITEIWFFFAQKFEAGKAFGQSIMNAIKAVFETVWNAIKAVWNTVLNAIMTIAKTIWNGIKSFLEGIWNGLKAVFTTVWNAIKSVATTVFNAIKSVFTSIWNAISSFFTSVLNTQKSIFTSVWNAIKGVASTVMNAIKSVFSSIWNAISSLISSVWNTIKSIITSGMNAARSIVTSVGNAIKSAFTQIWSTFSNIVSNTFNTVKNAVTNGLQSAVNIVKNFGNTFMNAGKGLIDMMAKGIKNAAGAVTGAIKDIASKARDFLPFSPAKTGPLSDIDKLDFGGPISDSINRATKGVQVKLATMLDLPVISATATPMNTNGGPVITNNNGGNTQQITVNIDPSNMDEFYQIVDFFNSFKQTSRARG